jgi:hypothetical protein
MINQKQLPIKFRELYVDAVWSNDYITNLTNEPSEPEDYPNALIDIGISLDKLDVDLNQKKILVIGSITPWIECFLLHKGVPKVYITDINEISIQHDNIIFINENNIINHNFDIILSYSSIEHIGLGRYGDEIDENGDIKYMNNLYNVLNENSILIISIPVAENYLVEGFWHRIYDKSRIEKLFEKYNILFSVKNGLLNNNIDYTFDNFYEHKWQNQPTICLKKIK